jgi:predicted transcriptional regulator/DNA-binding XRE family transcriptional regulator
MSRRTFLGRSVRRLRESHSLTQQAMAAALGISPSYLNLIEHDQRPVTASLILKLAEKFDADLASLSGEGERALELALKETFSEPLLSAEDVSDAEIAALADHAPNASRAVLALFRAWRIAREDSAGISVGSRKFLLPVEEARDWFHTQNNYFPAIEEAAEALTAALNATPGRMNRALADRLEAAHGVAVRVLPAESTAGAMRSFDATGRTLMLSEWLPPESRGFHMAFQLGLLEANAVIDEAIAEAQPSTREAETLIRVGLLNYFAGAVLMPYAAVLQAAQALRYDIDALCARFGTSFEQVCHRLSTLQRPGARGVAFFLLRVDPAGNIAKRFSAAGFPFSRFGGSCPRGIVHHAFATPGIVRTQVAELPDGAKFFCFARTLIRHTPHGEPPVVQAIGVGCTLADARALAYADGIDLASTAAVTGIGLSCRLCERADCRSRAFPPLEHRLVLDPTVKGASAYRFEPPARPPRR